jgi:hypothetical protein
MVGRDCPDDIAAAFVTRTSAAQAFVRKNAVVSIDPLDADGIAADFIYALYLGAFRGCFHRGQRIRRHL